LTACQGSQFAAQRRSLPAAADLVPDPVAVPRARASDDAVVYAGRVKGVAVENGRRLVQARENVARVRATYESGGD
jgi:hypothetical protein